MPYKKCNFFFIFLKMLAKIIKKKCLFFIFHIQKSNFAQIVKKIAQTCVITSSTFSSGLWAQTQTHTHTHTHRRTLRRRGTLPRARDAPHQSTGKGRSAPVGGRKKNRMGRGHHTYGRTSRLLYQIGPVGRFGENVLLTPLND